MASISKITLLGTLGRDPETRYLPSGQMTVQFTMAVNHKRKDAESVNWFRVSAFGRLAETLDRLTSDGALAKGRQVYVSGRFEAREYQGREGDTRTSLDVAADDVQLIGPREHVEAHNNTTQDDDGDAPF